MYTYNDLITYIKRRLGKAVNKLEFSDVEMLDMIKTESLREFSIYLPRQEFVTVTSANLVSSSFHNRYLIPTDSQIIDINEIFVNQNFNNVSDVDTAPTTLNNYQTYFSGMDQMELNKSYSAVTTYNLIPPKMVDIKFPKVNEDALSLYGFILELNVVHSDPSTIPFDQYPELRDMALGDIYLFLGAIRKKYQNMNTPYGMINVDGDSMIQDGTRLKEDAIQRLKTNPPRQYMYFLNDY